MFTHERLNVNQQLPQLLEPLLRLLVYLCGHVLTKPELLYGGKRAIFMKGVVDVWNVGEIELGVRCRPLQTRPAVGLDFEQVRLRHIR